MENRQESAIVPHAKSSSMIITDNGHATLPKKKKKAGPMNFFRVAMHAFRFGRGKSKSTQVQAASALRNVVGSIRPLHLQSDQTESPPPPRRPRPEPTEQAIFPEPFEAYTPSMGSSAWASPSASTASRYASANDLLQLLRKESEFDEEESEEDEEDKYYDDKCADDMIDSKADAFIASFYAQMRDQRETHHKR